MPTYSFQMSAGLAGSSVSVTAVGSSTVVASGTLDTNATFTASLPVGDYVAKAADGHYSYSSAGTVAASDPDQLADLNSTFARAINVKMGPYNAKGDGTTDDTAAIQAALNAVSTALGATTVVIPAGTYMIDGVNDAQTPGKRWIGGGLQPKTGTTLLLAPDAVLKIIPNTSPSYAAIYLGYGQNNVTIKGGQILGDRATHDYVTETSNPTFEYGYGVATRGAKDIRIEGMKITGCIGDGVFIAPEGMVGIAEPYRPSERVTVKDCTIDASRRNNISVIGCEQAWIENNLITNAGADDGIHAGTLPKYGIDIEGYGEGSTDYELPLKVTVRGNKFVGNAIGAVSNFNGYGVVIEGNYSDGNISYGFGTETVIANNVITNTANTTTPAITGNSGSTYKANTLITGNVITGFGTSIQVTNENTTVTGNFCRAFNDVGISITSATNAAVTGNNITDGVSATSVAIKVGTSTLVKATANTVRNVNIGFSVLNTSTGIVLDDNIITKSVTGFSIAGGCQVVIKGNTTDLAGNAGGQAYDATWTSTAIVFCEDNVFRNSSTYSISAANTAGSGVSRIIGNRIIDSASTTQISLTGGQHDVIGNTFVVKRATVNATAVLLAGASDKSRVMHNVAYNSGAAAYAYLVGSTAATNTRVIGNTVATASASVVNGAGSEIVAANNIVAP